MDDERVWFLNTAEGAQGPYAPSELGPWMTEGLISEEWYVWREGMATWSRIADTPDLGAAPVSVVVPPVQASPSESDARSRSGRVDPPPPDSPSPLHHDALAAFMEDAPPASTPSGGTGALDGVKKLFRRKASGAPTSAPANRENTPKGKSRVAFIIVMFGILGVAGYLYYLQTTDPEGFIVYMKSIGLDPDLVFAL